MRPSRSSRPTASRDDPYTLIVTDMHMPGMDGFGLVDRIEEIPASPAQRSLCSLRFASRRYRALQIAGNLGILVKPIRQADLRDALLRVLGADLNRPEPAAVRVPVSPETLRPALSNVSLDILLAEDNAVNQLVATRLLQKRNHQVVVASNGLQALEAFNRGSFDLLFMDVQMPEMDGMEATAEIRAQEKPPALTSSSP